MYIGLQGGGFDSAVYSTSIAEARLLPESEVEVTSADGQPVVWSHRDGKGR